MPLPVADPEHPVKVAVTFARIYGATLLAILANTFVYGIVLTITMQYFKNYSNNDLKVLKLTILVLIFLATLQTVFASHQLYWTFILKEADDSLTDVISFSVPGYYSTTSLTAFIAQLFFSGRIWSVSKGLHSRLRYFVVPVILLAFLQTSAGLGLVTLMGISKTYSKLTRNTGLLIKLTTLQGGATAACDVLISISLCLAFHSHRSGIKRSNSIINRLILYAINRAMATGICALLSVLLYNFYSGTFYFIIPLLVNTHFYVLSAVTILTSREGLREEIDQPFHLSDMVINTTTSTSTNATLSKVEAGQDFPSESQQNREEPEEYGRD